MSKKEIGTRPLVAKSVSSLLTTGVIFLMLSPVDSHAADIEDCVRSIFMGEEVKGARVGNHDFNCKSASVYQHAFNEGELSFYGELSHRLSGRPDDQMSYTFDLEENGDIRDFDVSITSRGGISGLIDSNALTSIVLSPISQMSKKSMTAKLNEAGWREAATIIAGTVAATMQESQINARRNSNNGSIEWMIDRPGGDYKRLVFGSTLRPETCRKQCNDDAQCRAWTYVPAGIQTNGAVCWLKSSIPTARPSARMVSGIK